MTGSQSWTGGSALAGTLNEVFNVDLGAAVGRCGSCGWSGPLAEARVYDRAPGVVARCPNCDQPLVRMVGGPGRAWLDLRGLAYLQVPLTDRT
ncbi:MAG TPA: DUF6510 family protein [Actinomycetota bacterium]|jgi:Family of unknown function (DUF6510)